MGILKNILWCPRKFPEFVRCLHTTLYYATITMESTFADYSLKKLHQKKRKNFVHLKT